MKRALGSLCFALLLVLFAPGFVLAAGPLTVFVSVPPQKHFVEKIGGERVSVLVMAGPGANPHAYEPKPSQMKALTGAAVYFAVGDPFELVWLDKFRAANPAMRVVETQAGIERMPMEEHHRHDADEPKAGRKGQGRKGGHEADHDHDGELLDPHVWLAPSLVRLQAERVRDGLIMADPDGRAYYEERARAFAGEIDALDAEIKGLLADRAGASFLVFHPAWGYFARDYGLVQVPIELAGKEPSPRELRQLTERAKAKGYPALFVQPQFSRRTAETIAKAVGARVIEADPLAEDWAANLRAVARKFKDASR